MRRIAILFLLLLSAGTALAAGNQSPPTDGGHECERDKKEQTTS